MKFSLDEIIKATGAKVLKNTLENNKLFTFSTDTRTIKPGEIYLPLNGENFNGEDFIDKALESGAVGCFTSKGYPSPQPSPSRGEGATVQPFNRSTVQLILQVGDTLTAYSQLASFYRKKINPATIAITGSSGKTTTKEMAYCVLREKFKTHKSELNFNNEIGLCKTILSMPVDTEVLILEMGMRGLGEIELLSKYSEPDIAVITNIGTAHVGRLGSRENIAKAKCEIVKHMKEDGILIAHDDELIKEFRCEDAKMRRCVEIHTSTPPRLYTSPIYFSLNNTKIIEHSIGYSKFIYKEREYELNIEGDYNVQNALAAIEIGLQLKMKPSEINEGLKKYSPLEKRWEIQEVKGYKIINDSYNANPESMRAMIETVLDIYPPPVLFVLGDMGELGEKEIEYHQQIGEFLLKSIKKCNCEALPEVEAIQEDEIGLPRRDIVPPRNDIIVITVGKLANEITKVLSENGILSKNFKNNLQTSRYILDNVKFGTTIILKASRSMKFEEIINEVKCKM